MMQKASFLTFSFLLVIFVSSCDSNRVYDNSTEIPNAKWNREDLVEHSIKIVDTASVYNLYLNLRNSTNYKYSNLYVFMNTKFPNGKTRRDTIECPLADKKGMWFGKKAGSVIENQILFRRNSLFPDTGTYIFSIEQAMREISLPGIVDIGMRLETVE